MRRRKKPKKLSHKDFRLMLDALFPTDDPRRPKTKYRNPDRWRK